MSKRLNVYGIGNAIMDLQLFVSEDEFSQLGLEKGSMTLVDAEGQNALLEKFKAKEINQASGGSAANTIIGLTQLGAKSAYGCLVASDDFGTAYASEMSSLGVELHTDKVNQKQTGSCVVAITPDAERTMNTFLGVSAEFSPEHVSEAHIADSEWLYIEGYLFSSEQGCKAVKKAIESAKSAGTKIAITFSDGFIVNVFGDALKEAVSSADLVFANAGEAMAFAGVSDEREAFEALKKEIPSVAMTLGSRGAWIWHEKQEHVIEPFPVKAVDDTGAGDMFAGGFLYGLSQGYYAEVSGKIACFLASKVVSQLGPRLNEDYKSDVSNLL